MTRNPRRRPLSRHDADLLSRAVPPDVARERSRRGAALARAALAGELPDPDTVPEPVDVVTACRQCFAPHPGQRGTLCPRCVGELDGGP